LNTILFSDEQVTAYLRDLMERLDNLGEETPKVWCPIGPSGAVLAQAAVRAGPHVASTIQHVLLTFDRATEQVSFPQDENPRRAVEGRNVLLIDGSVHSGNTLMKAYRAVEGLGAKEISSYALVVRSGTSVLPSFFGLVIGDHDRAIFLKKSFPNNRLPVFGCVRKLSDRDQGRSMIHSGEHFIDKFSWSDFLYEMWVDRRRKAYLYERGGTIRGLISFRLTPGESILIDTLGVDKTFQKQGVAGHLMRWGETCGRNAHCGTIQLWSIERRKSWYEKRGYKAFGAEMDLDGEKFHLMAKKVLYNLPEDDVLTMGS